MGKGRAPCCDKSKVKRGPWSPAEDLRLITFIQKHGHDNWRSLPKQAGLLRCGKSCRLRWINYLRPDVKRGNFTKEEEDTIIRLHQSLGNKWSKIASYLPGRTDNEIKNVWNTHLKKKVLGLKTNKDNESNKESSLTVSSSSTLSSSSTQFSHGQVSSESLDHHDHDHEMGHDDDVHHHTMPKNPSDHQDPSSQLFSEQELGNSTLLLEEVNKPDMIFSSVDHQIPLESDLEFWNMLGGVEPFCPNEVHQSNDVGANQSSDFGGHVYNNCNNNNNNNKELEVESSWNWIRYLESELGLDSTEQQDGIMVNNKENVSTVDNGVHHDDGQYQPSIPSESCEKMKIKSPEIDNMGLGYFHQVWPYQSPHRSSVF